jgi:hypothetical protein
MYRPVDESVVRRLTEIAGPKAVFSDEDTLNIYSKDETLGLSHRPEIVVKPGKRNILRVSSFREGMDGGVSLSDRAISLLIISILCLFHRP